jgi:signal transduction histidine kinase
MAAPSKSSLAKLGLRAAGVAHDIAHPLSVALLASQNIEGKGAAQLKASLRRMEKLLEALRIELRSEPAKTLSVSVDLGELSKDIFSNLKLSDQKRVSLKLKGKAKTDAVALHRILENLVLNALRHSDGDVEVTQTHKANQLTLFVNGGATKSKRTKGWGVGLVSSHDLAKRLGYALTIDIKPGRSQARLVAPKQTKQ